MSKDPHTILLHRHITEKSSVLSMLQANESNPSVRRCQSPKFVFLVHPSANKQEIGSAVEQIFPGVTVEKVNVINRKGRKRRVRGRIGMTKGQRKAIVTLAPGDTLGAEEEN